jgi:hypothetical protein
VAEPLELADQLPLMAFDMSDGHGGLARAPTTPQAVVLGGLA